MISPPAIGAPGGTGRASRCGGSACRARSTCRSTRRCSPRTRSALIKRDDVDIVIEVVGGIEHGAHAGWSRRSHARQASVVTANKALLAEDGGTLHDAAAQKAVP